MNWKNTKEGTLLLIIWGDVVSDPAWLEDEIAERYQAIVCKDIGWFVNDDKLNIRITTSVNNCGEKNVTVIPKGCIRSVQKIKYESKN